MLHHGGLLPPGSDGPKGQDERCFWACQLRAALQGTWRRLVPGGTVARGSGIESPVVRPRPVRRPLVAIGVRGAEVVVGFDSGDN